MIIADDTFGCIEQSEHWELRKDLPELAKGFHKCYPCDEGFPVFPWHSDEPLNKPLFEIMTAWGLRTEAWINDSREFSAEGLEWTIFEDQVIRNVPEIQVAAWRRISERSKPRPRRTKPWRKKAS